MGRAIRIVREPKVFDEKIVESVPAIRSRTTGRPAEVSREGSGIKVGGTADDGLAAQMAYISVYIKDAGNLSPAKDLPVSSNGAEQ